MMDTQLQAQLYLADQRGCSQRDYFRSYHSFSFGQYADEHKMPFGALQVVNDDTLTAGNRIRMQVESDTDVVILPIVGGLEYKSSLGDGFLEAGQVQIFSLANGMSYEIINPYETELINFVQIWLTNNSSDFTPGLGQTSFDLSNKNNLLSAFSVNENALRSRGFIGKFDGRNDGIYPLENPETTGVFVFVLSGVFEVQDRLLHERDGLSLTNGQEPVIEFEALSNDALVLLMEIPLRS
ncbi:pirin family protein [Spirosoma jeollabukense]